MKLFIAVSALVAAVAAQDLSSLPACGQMCIANMVQIANTQFGCANGDVKCYCSNANFARGLNDCSVQACGEAVRAQVVAFGTAYCASAGVGGTGGTGTTSGGTGGTTGGTGGATTSGGAPGSATTTGAGASASSAGSSAASSVSSALSGAASSASSALSSIGASVSGAAGSAASSAASGASSATSRAGAMQTGAPLAGAGVLGLAALLLV